VIFLRFCLPSPITLPYKEQKVETKKGQVDKKIDNNHLTKSITTTTTNNNNKSRHKPAFLEFLEG